MKYEESIHMLDERMLVLSLRIKNKRNPVKTEPNRYQIPLNLSCFPWKEKPLSTMEICTCLLLHVDTLLSLHGQLICNIDERYMISYFIDNFRFLFSSSVWTPRSVFFFFFCHSLNAFHQKTCLLIRCYLTGDRNFEQKKYFRNHISIHFCFTSSLYFKL